MRKFLLYAYVAVMAVPYAICYLLGDLGDMIGNSHDRLRQWAYPDKYARIPRGPEDGYLVPPAMQETLARSVFSRQEMHDFLQKYDT